MRISPRIQAILQALLVTFLWASSWVLIKNNIEAIPPLTFAGLRYTIASLLFLPGLLQQKEALEKLERKDFISLAALGLVLYAMTQGGQFLTLKYLDAIPFSLILNFTSPLVAFYAAFMGQEKPTLWQWRGIASFLVGVLLYFLPKLQGNSNPAGYALAVLTVFANAVSSLLGRKTNRGGRISPFVVTSISMGIGGVVLLVMGLILQGLPTLSLKAWLTILWLASVNTAFAFWLWNKSLQALTAVESSTINSTMMVQIAILARIFLGERLDFAETLGLGIALIGILLVSLKPSKKHESRVNYNKNRHYCDK
ncbi:MAG: DMT family transporter [Anaerolineaceae bacterium]|nr:DMT family transporter [Anaerolineaceae bacterium]